MDDNQNGRGDGLVSVEWLNRILDSGADIAKNLDWSDIENVREWAENVHSNLKEDIRVYGPRHTTPELATLKAENADWQRMAQGFVGSGMMADEFENEPHTPALFGMYVQNLVEQVDALSATPKTQGECVWRWQSNLGTWLTSHEDPEGWPFTFFKWERHIYCPLCGERISTK